MDPRLEEIHTTLTREIERRRREGSAAEIHADIRTIIEVLDELDRAVQIMKTKAGE